MLTTSWRLTVAKVFIKTNSGTKSKRLGRLYFKSNALKYIYYIWVIQTIITIGYLWQIRS